MCGGGWRKVASLGTAVAYLHAWTGLDCAVLRELSCQQIYVHNWHLFIHRPNFSFFFNAGFSYGA